MEQGLTSCTLILAMFPSDRNVLVIMVELCESCSCKVRLGWDDCYCIVETLFLACRKHV